MDQADSSRRPQASQRTSPASRYRRVAGPSLGWELYASVLVVYEVNNLLAGVDMTERVAGAWMHEKMD